jgi:hypothetical protein
MAFRAGRRRSSWLLLAGLAVATAAILIGWQQRAGDRRPAAIGALQREAIAPAERPGLELDLDADRAGALPGAPIAATPRFDPATPTTPLVADDMPVVEMLELLGSRARSGDPVAACELARALGQCRIQSLQARVTRPPPPDGAGPPALERYVDSEAQRQEWAERLARRCDGVGHGELAEAVEFTARAAINGHLPSLIEFINAPILSAGDFIRSPALADAYRRQAWPLLQRAFAAGHSGAAAAAMMQLASPHVGSPLSGVAPLEYQDPDAARALLDLLLAEDGRRPHGPAHTSGPPSEQARATAQRWIDELFGGVLPARNEDSWPRQRPSLPDAGLASPCRDSDNWLDPAGR